MDKEILAGRAGTYDSSQRWTCSSLRKPLVRVDMEAWRETKDGTRRLLLDRGWLAGALYTSPWGRPCTSYVHMQLMWPRDRVTETSPAPCPGQRPPRHREAPRHRTRKRENVASLTMSTVPPPPSHRSRNRVALCQPGRGGHPHPHQHQHQRAAEAFTCRGLSGIEHSRCSRGARC